MTAAVSERLPLVFARPRALRAAKRLLPGRILESEVRAAILAGRITRRRPRADAIVLLGDELVAIARRCESPSGSGRKAWQVTAVEPRRRRGDETPDEGGRES